jgi:hypothetical protein
MSNAALARVSAKTAAEVCKHFPLGDEAKKFLREGLTPRQFLDLLTAKEQFVDAVRLLAHALPRREAAWWACLCARAVAGPKPPAEAAAAVAAAEKWVSDPSEDNRRAAWAAAEKAGLGTPAGCSAAAAFWSGGSLGPPDVPAIPPGEFLTAHVAGCAVLLAAVQTEPAKAPEKYRKFLALGIEVAAGTNQWKEK